MGDYADGEEKKANRTHDTSPHQKPRPKGSDGSKPAGRGPGQKAKPKKSGAAMQSRQTDALLQGELYIDTDHPTGDPGIDSGGAGACAKGGQGCFLKPNQRNMLINNFQARVTRAELHYEAAIGDCRLSQLLKKTDELPWYVSLLLGAAFSLLEGAIGAGLKALKASGASRVVADATKARLPGGSLQQDLKAAVEDANLDGVEHAVGEVAHDADAEVKGLTEKQVETLVKTGVDKAKEATTVVIAGPVTSDSKETNEKNAALAYIDYLRRTSAIFFQGLSEGPPGTATDAELLALWRSLDTNFHSVEMYRLEIDAAIERYLNSPVSEIGRSTDWEGQERVEKEVRIAWLITKGGGKRLIYMDRLFDAWYQERLARGDRQVQRSDAYDADANRISLDQEAGWTSHGVTRRDSEKPIREDKMLKFVEPEFREMALQKQRKTWLAEPETFMEDWEHQVAFGVPSIRKVAGS